MFGHTAIKIINVPSKDKCTFRTHIVEDEAEISIIVETNDLIEQKYITTEEDNNIIEAFLMNNEGGMPSNSLLELTSSMDKKCSELQKHPLVVLNVVIPNEISEYGRIENYKMNHVVKRFLANIKK